MPEPTVWTVTYPPEPGPDVTAVRDVHGDVWHRVDAGWQESGSFFAYSWADVLEYEPLTDATPGRAKEPSDDSA